MGTITRRGTRRGGAHRRRRLARGTVARRRLGILGVALMAAGAFPVAGTVAATEEGAGWWSRTGEPLPMNPTAPHVEEGQLHVQGGSGGAMAVAALRWSLLDDESSPMLTITPADGSIVPPEAVLTACRAAGPWEDASGGAWDDAPEADCASSVDGVLAEDGSAIELDLSSLLDGTTLDVVLTPGDGPAFSLTFDRPSLQTTSTGTGGFDTGDSASFAPIDGSSPPPASSSPAPASSGSSFTAPPTEVAAPPAVEVVEEAPAVEEQPSQAAAARPAASTAPDSDRGRTLGLLVLLTGAAVVAWAWTASAPSGGSTAVATDTSPSRAGGRHLRARGVAPPAPS